jgi:regulator of replication initiation timing
MALDTKSYRTNTVGQINRAASAINSLVVRTESAATACSNVERLCDEVDSLRAENERLRATLEENEQDIRELRYHFAAEQLRNRHLTDTIYEVLKHTAKVCREEWTREQVDVYLREQLATQAPLPDKRILIGPPRAALARPEGGAR